MPRVKRGVVRRQKRKKLSKLTKGYFQNKSKLYKFMKEASEKAGVYAYTGRKRKKRDYRALWIIRINAAARENGVSYSVFMRGLKKPASSSIARASLISPRPHPRHLPSSPRKPRPQSPLNIR
jgi:large subunit ribosomal protein L20